MAQAAERHAVLDGVVMRQAPRHDMGGVNGGMAIGGQHPDAADGAAMIIHVDNNPSERLIPHRRGVSFCALTFLNLLMPRLLQQRLAVLKRFFVDDPLFDQAGMQFRRKACFDQGGSQQVARFFPAEQCIQLIVQLHPQHDFLQLGHAPDLAGGGEDRLHPRFRNVVPEFV